MTPGQAFAMRLYLSSFRMGDRVDELRGLVGGRGHAAIIANGLDHKDAERRRAGVELEAAALGAAGLTTEEVDLQEHFDGRGDLEARLRTFDLLWLRGGNVFVLRTALHRAGADDVIRRLLTEDALVYGGYSAGPCVLGPTIAAFERTDDPTAVEVAYEHTAITDGLGIIDFVVVPHVDSPDHPASPALSELADDLEAAGQDVLRLRDGEVLVVDDPAHVVGS